MQERPLRTREAEAGVRHVSLAIKLLPAIALFRYLFPCMMMGGIRPFVHMAVVPAKRQMRTANSLVDWSKKTINAGECTPYLHCMSVRVSSRVCAWRLVMLYSQLITQTNQQKQSQRNFVNKCCGFRPDYCYARHDQDNSRSACVQVYAHIHQFWQHLQYVTLLQ